ncbi:MAG: DUF3105 domain-containing protein [Actinomycetia bacterium]|nr:DUF3105 domain-containing protein [Actinomycetes bacterium]
MSNKKKIQKAPATKTQGMPGESPWPKRLAWIGGVGLVVALVLVVFLSQPELRGVPDGTETQAVGDPAHVDGQLHEDGEVPAGGAHNAVWQNCGFYADEVNSENAVHSLEHGAVWIAYDPALGSSLADELRQYVSRNEKVLVSPVPGQSAPIIATAWGQQLELDDPSDTRLGQFVNEFTGSSGAPEPGGRCNGGVGSPSF